MMLAFWIVLGVLLYCGVMFHTFRVLLGHFKANKSYDPAFPAFMLSVFLPPVAIVMAVSLSFGGGGKSLAIEPRPLRKEKERQAALRRVRELERELQVGNFS